jgi:hypothetical protein
MAIAPGSGASIQWNGSAVEELESIDLDVGFEQVDSTKCGAAAGTNEYTVQNPKVTFVFKRDVAATVQNAIFADMAAKTARAVKVYETAAKYWTWNCRIASLKKGVNAKGLVVYTATIDGTSDGAAATYN